jgi:hypothetical protein
VFERIDDSNGRLQNVYHAAAAGLPDLVGRLDEADKASIPDRLFAPAVSDDYGSLGQFVQGIALFQAMLSDLVSQ